MKNRKGPENCILNKNSFWAGGDTTVAGAHTTAGKNRQLPGTITVPGLVTTKPITNWLTLDQFSTQCKENKFRTGRINSPWVRDEGGCAFADAYIHSAECKLNLEALEAADQCIRKANFRAVWGEVFPEVDVKEYDDVLTVMDDMVKMNDYLLTKCKLLNLSLKCRQDVCEYMKKEREGPAGQFNFQQKLGHCYHIDPTVKCYHYILLDDGLNTPGQAKGGFCHEAN